MTTIDGYTRFEIRESIRTRLKGLLGITAVSELVGKDDSSSRLFVITDANDYFEITVKRIQEDELPIR
jgi:hypothetical protein